MAREVWDVFEREFVEVPEEMAAFLQEIEQVCRKHGFSLGHEDTEGGFKVHLLNEKNIRWVNAAAKHYTKDVDPETGIALAPNYMGDGCPAAGISCLTCKFKGYCYPEWENRAQERFYAVVERAIEKEPDTDRKIRAAGSYIIQKHEEAWKELAKGDE